MDTDENNNNNNNKTITQQIVANLDRILIWVSIIGGGLALAVLVVLSVFNVVVMRKLLNSPITGAEDVMVLLLISIVAVSIALGARTGAHIEIEVLESKMSEAFAKWSLVFVKAIGVAILGIMCWRLIHAGDNAARFGETTQLLHVSFGPFYYMLAVSIAVYAVALILDISRIVRSGVAPKLKIGGEVE